MNPTVSKFHCSYVSGGTCGGDSGGPFLTSVEDLDTFEIKTVQLGVLHGGLLPCTNTRFPAIYTRLDHPEIHAWLLDQITTKGKFLLQIYLRSRCLKSYLPMYVHIRCPVRCPDWSCSQPTCSKYHGESYDSLYFFQIDATFFCRSLKILT